MGKRQVKATKRRGKRPAIPNSKLIYCAACGRSNSGPEAVKTVRYLGIEWCSLCAAIGKTADSGNYVSQPSPGRMFESPPRDPLDAWQDCYSMKPKKKISKKWAKEEVQRAWRLWDGDKSGKEAMFIFFGWIQRHRPYFLTCSFQGDPWQTVHSWLLSAD